MLEILIHTFIHTIKDNLKLFPFLFVAFLLLELIEHKFNDKMKNYIRKSGKFGPVVGSLLGVFPQCGFSVLATNFYITRVISVGTLVAIYLSTSDEMLPIMISKGVGIRTIITILLIKFLVGVIFGFIVDIVIRKKEAGKKYDYHLCEDEHCKCESSIFKSSFKHALNILGFILLVSFVINFLYEFVGADIIAKAFMKNNMFGPFIGALIGLIPNCASSVALTELYLSNAINFGTCISGLLVGSGVSTIVLFKSNKIMRENIFIVSILYLIGVLVGIFMEFVGIVI